MRFTRRRLLVGAGLGFLAPRPLRAQSAPEREHQPRLDVPIVAEDATAVPVQVSVEHSQATRGTAIMAKPKPPARPQLRAGDVVVLRQSGEHVEGEIIAILADGRYKVRWLTGLAYRDRIATVTVDEIHKKT